MVDLRKSLAEERQALRLAYLSKPDPQLLLRRHSALVDRIVREVWRDTALDGAALVATGGYGRGELYPRSDVDLLVLLPDGINEAGKEKVEKLIGTLWDLGLEIGHSVRTVQGCVESAAEDITIRTTLMEARYLAGSRRLFSDLVKSLEETKDPLSFFKAKKLEQEQRHAKHQDTPYSLEPNLKEAPGGLRDLQVIQWIARAAGMGRRWADLVANGLIERGEARQLAQLESHLQDLRIRLHYLAGRREDRIVFDFQNALAAQYGDVDTPDRRASEAMMQRYYRAAKTVTQLNTIVLQNIGARLFPQPEESPRSLNERFEVRNELLHVVEEELFQRQPSAILESFLLMMQHEELPRVLNERFRIRGELLHIEDESLFERDPVTILESFLLMMQHHELRGMTAPTLRALWRARRRLDASFRRDPLAQLLFLQILQQPRGIVHEFRRMNQYGILGRYLPEFGRIVGQMQHDLFHVYTVDQHILMVLRNVRRFTMPEFAHEFPLCSELMNGFERHWLIYIAALYHDIAKGRGGDHSELGTVDVREFSKRHGLSEEDSDLVAFLVERHLAMSHVAQKRDVYDPEVIRAFAEL